MPATVSYFDVAASLARRHVPVITDDRTERAMHTVHDAIMDFESAIRVATRSDRLAQLEERAEALMHLWSQVYETARDKRQAVQDVGR